MQVFNEVSSREMERINVFKGILNNNVFVAVLGSTEVAAEVLRRRPDGIWPERPEIVGAGGELGCTAQAIARAFEERRTGFGARAGELIAAAREERLSTIDEEAAATQARVEQIEREYMERVRREQEAELPGESPNGAAGRVVEPLAVPPGE